MTILVKNASGANVTISTIDDLLPAVDGLEASLTSILAKIITAPATEAKQDTANTSLASILAKIAAAPATEAKQDTLNTAVNTLNTSVNSIKTATVIAAGENRIGSVGGSTANIDITLSLDTAIYAANDVLADTQVVTNAMRISDGTGILQSVTVIDQDDQKAQLKIFILSADVPLGTENAAPSITDANAVNIIGAPITFETSDYTDLGGVSVAGKDNLGRVVKAATGARHLYVAVLNGSGTPTYTAAGIKLRLGFLQD